MGLDVTVPRTGSTSIAALLERLAQAGTTAMLVMVDGALVMPGVAPPTDWRDVRLRTLAGTVTLAQRPGAVAVVVFGNADPALVAAQQAIAKALGELP